MEHQLIALVGILLAAIIVPTTTIAMLKARSLGKNNTEE